MKWYLKGDRNGERIGYKLEHGSETMMSFSLQPARQFIRMICNGACRRFMLQKCGLLANKMIFINEYGVEIGRSVFNLWQHNSGSILFNDKKFYYSIVNRANQLILQLSNHQHHPVQELAIESDGLEPMLDKRNFAEYTALLLSCCWFLTEEKKLSVPLQTLL